MSTFHRCTGFKGQRCFTCSALLGVVVPAPLVESGRQHAVECVARAVAVSKGDADRITGAVVATPGDTRHALDARGAADVGGGVLQPRPLASCLP